MREELKLTLDVGDLIALVSKRYKVAISQSPDGGYTVDGDPLAIAKLHGAVRRVAKSK